MRKVTAVLGLVFDPVTSKAELARGYPEVTRTIGGTPR